MKRTRGFTLIELMVVIAIIGMLASVVLAALTVARQHAADTRFSEEARQIRTAVVSYYLDHNAYPDQTYGTPYHWMNWDMLGNMLEGGGYASRAIYSMSTQYEYFILCSPADVTTCDPTNYNAMYQILKTSCPGAGGTVVSGEAGMYFQYPRVPSDWTGATYNGQPMYCFFPNDIYMQR